MAQLDESIASGQAGHLTDHDTIHAKVNKVLTGTSTPESAVTGVVGDLFLRTDGGAGTSLYIKESGSGNTGWVAVSSASVALLLAGGTMTGTLAMGNKELSGPLDPTGGTHVGDRDFNDARYAELSGATMSGDLTMGGNDITNVVNILGVAGSHVIIQPRSGLETQLRDDTGAQRIRVSPNATGDLIFSDKAGVTMLLWDESDSGWEMYGHLDMTGQILKNPVDPTLGIHVGDRDYNDARYATDATTRIDNTDSPYTILSSDSVILVDTATAVVTVNLPATAAQSILVKRVIGGTNAVTIARNGSDLIDTDGSTAASKTLGSLGAHWSGSASSADSRWYTIGEHGTVT